MSDALPIISVLTSALVALGTPLINSRLERRKLQVAATDAKADDFRVVADAVGVALATAEERLADAATAVEAACREDATDAARVVAQESLDASRVAVTGVRQTLHRVALRLGWDSEAITNLSAAQRELANTFSELTGVFEGGPSADDPDAWSEVTAVLAKPQHRYEERRAAFYSAAQAHLSWPLSR